MLSLEAVHISLIISTESGTNECSPNNKQGLGTATLGSTLPR